jgi:TRAP-type C4-dicarboxylate transport system permease small subunit
MSADALSPALSSGEPAPQPGGGRPSLPGLVVETVASGLLTASALVALLQVFYRYALDNSLSWPEELAQWMFIWAIFLGAAALVAGKGHIAIETFSRSMSAASRRWHRGFVDGCTAAVGMIMLCEGISFVAKTTYVSPGLQWSFKYLYAAVPTGVFSLFDPKRRSWLDRLLHTEVRYVVPLDQQRRYIREELQARQEQAAAAPTPTAAGTNGAPTEA